MRVVLRFFFKIIYKRNALPSHDEKYIFYPPIFFLYLEKTVMS